MIDFDQKTALITGANGAIGRATATLFLQLGANLVLSDVDAIPLDGFARSLDVEQKRVLSIHQDARKPEHAEAAVRLAIDRFGALDQLVTAAGFLRRQSLGEMTDEQMDQMLAVNFHGVFNACRAAARVMGRGAAIVNLASLAAHTGRERGAHYAAAKGAVLSFTRSLAAELGPDIRVNAVSPGFIGAGLAQAVLADYGDAITDRIPLKRLGNELEIAHAIAYLCSDCASYITGHTLHVNGGLYVNG